MAYAFNGTTQFLSTASAPTTAAPLTIYGRFNSSSDASNQTLAAIANKTSDTNSFWMVAGGAQVDDPVRVITYGTVSTSIADTTTGFLINTWFDAAGVFSAINNRTAYINGGSSVTNTESQTPIGLNTFGIGVLNRLNIASYFSGGLAETAIWNAALTGGEVASLAKGFKPTRVRPQSLVFYAPLVRDLQDLRGALTITNNNSATVADHPRVY